jgi:hypothetical protein
LTNRRMRARMSGGVRGGGATPPPTRFLVEANSATHECDCVSFLVTYRRCLRAASLSDGCGRLHRDWLQGSDGDPADPLDDNCRRQGLMEAQSRHGAVTARWWLIESSAFGLSIGVKNSTA